MNRGSAMADARVSVRKRSVPLRPNSVSATGNGDSAPTSVVSSIAVTPASASTEALSGGRRRSASLLADATARTMAATASTTAATASKPFAFENPNRLMHKYIARTPRGSSWRVPNSRLTPATANAVDAYWAAWFACPVEALRPARALVLPHAGHEGYNGIYAMTFGAEPIISVPRGRLSELTPRLRVWTAATLRDSAQALESLGEPAREAVGPAWLGYGDAGTFRAEALPRTARLLGDADASSIDALRDACPPVEWEHGGSRLGRDPVAGSFAEEAAGALAALAGYEVWGERLAHIAVVAHPAYRGRGHARAAVAAIARHALEQGLVLQYRTLASNTASRRIADSLGFEPGATSLAIRLR